MAARPTLFLVDGDPAVHKTIETLAREMALACEIFTSGLPFLDTIDPSRQGCLLAELRILDVSGPQIQRRLAAARINIPVLFLTAHATVPAVVRVMRDGALGVLEKPIDEDELREQIQLALEFGAKQRQEADNLARLRARFARLDEKERAVLDLLLDGKHCKEIAESLSVSMRTVELRHSKIMKKLDARSLSELFYAAFVAYDGCANLLGLDVEPALGWGVSPPSSFGGFWDLSLRRSGAGAG